MNTEGGWRRWSWQAGGQAGGQVGGQAGGYADRTLFCCHRAGGFCCHRLQHWRSRAEGGRWGGGRNLTLSSWPALAGGELDRRRYLEQSLAQRRHGETPARLCLDVDTAGTAGRAEVPPLHVRLGLGLGVRDITVQHLQTSLQNVLKYHNNQFHPVTSLQTLSSHLPNLSDY